MSQPLGYVGRVLKVKIYGIPTHGFFFMEFPANGAFQATGNEQIVKKLAEMIAVRERNIDGIHEGGSTPIEISVEDD